MSFEFEQRGPTGPLASFVDSVWWARGRIGHAREHIAPSGATVAVINLGDPILHATEGARAMQIVAKTGWLIGPHDQPSLNEPLGGTHCYGVVATPIGCEVLFGLDPRALRGRVAPLEEWLSGPALREELRGVTAERGLARLLESLESELNEPPAGIGRIARAIAWLECDPGLSVTEVAERLGISHAYLDREFARIVGLSPRTLAAILRVQRLLSELDVREEPDWIELVERHGWYDQSHMIREFKRYTGVAPTAYVEAQRANFDPSQLRGASGFVPEGSRVEVKSVQDGSL